MRNLFWAILLLSFISAGAGAQEILPREWPKIAPLKKIFSFPDMSHPEVDLIIPGLDGGALYKLECRSGDSYEGTDFDYSGDFECRLNSASGQDSFRTLLTYDPLQPRDWESRGRFFISDLEGTCGDYPEFGRVRTFRLRGMRLRLSLGFTGHGSLFPSNPGRPASAAMHFSVEARQDAAALTQIAEDVPYADPAVVEPAPDARTCSRVVPKHMDGNLSENEWRRQGLGPPFSEVACVEKTELIPPRDPRHGPMHPEPVAAPTGTDVPSQFFYLPIAAPGGEIAYEFECSAYGERIGGAGLHCGLYPAGKSVNLLADSADPYTRRSRAVFLPRQLEANCGAYPEWGAMRRFRLRGMQITVELMESVFSPPDKQPGLISGAIRSARMRVRVESDPSATSPAAAPSRVLDWESAAGPGTCAHVLVSLRAGK